MIDNQETVDLQDKIELLELEKKRIQDFIDSFRITNEALENHLNLLVNENTKLREIIARNDRLTKKYSKLVNVIKDNCVNGYMPEEGVKTLIKMINK